MQSLTVPTNTSKCISTQELMQSITSPATRHALIYNPLHQIDKLINYRPSDPDFDAHALDPPMGSLVNDTIGVELSDLHLTWTAPVVAEPIDVFALVTWLCLAGCDFLFQGHEVEVDPDVIPCGSSHGLLVEYG